MLPNFGARTNINVRCMNTKGNNRMRPTHKGRTEVVHTNPWNRITRQEVAFGQSKKTFFINNFGPRSGVVVIRKAAVLMVRQYRLLPDSYTLEIPGGKVEPGESHEAAIIRECEEETGWRCNALEPLVTYYPGLDNVNNRTTLFCSRNATKIREHVPDPTEVMEVVWVSLQECLADIYSGRQQDALTMMGVLGYAARTKPGP